MKPAEGGAPAAARVRLAFVRVLLLAWCGGGFAPSAWPQPAASASTATAEASATTIAELEAIALALHAAGQSAEAIEPARQALLLRRQRRDDPLGLALALANLGRMLLSAERWPDAEQALGESLRIRLATPAAGDEAIASSLHKLGGLFEATGADAKALQHYRQAQARAAHGAAGSLLHAAILRDLGALLARRGDAAAARTALAEAMSIVAQRDAADAAASAGTEATEVRAGVLLEQAAMAHRERQDDAAGRLFSAAVAAYRGAADANPVGLATALIGASSWARATGRWNEALAMLREAQALSRGAHAAPHADVARATHALGDMLRLAGDHNGAAQAVQEALAMRRQLLPPGHPDTAASQDLLALIWLEAGRPAPALAQARAAQATWQRQPQRRLWLAANLHNQGAALFSLRRYAEARAAFARALALRTALLGAMHPATATTRNQLAECLDALGQRAAAARQYQQALSALLEHGAAPLETAMALARYADHFALQGQRGLSIFLGKQAVNTLQGLRASLSSADAALQQSFVAGREDVYQRLSARLLDAGRLAEAEQVHRMLKEDELRQFTRSESATATTQATLVGGEAPASADWNRLAAGLADAGRQLRALVGQTISDDRTEAERRGQLRELRAALRESNRRLESFIVQTQRLLQGSETAATQQVALAGIESAQGALVRDAPAGTVLVHYVQLDDELRVVLTTRDVVVPRVVAVSRERLNQVIGQYRRQIFQRDPALRATARQLYDWLIEPIAGDLEAVQARTVMLSLTGTLRYLPFAALHDGKGWFVERYAPVLTTLGAKQGLGSATAAARGWNGSGFGLTRAVPGFEPLPAVRRELAGIIGPEGLAGEVRLDADFTFDNLQSALDDDPRVMHIATHVVFRPGTESESYMLLGDGKNLSLADFRTLPLKGLDLLTLSACDTAVGGGLNANGREIEGFAGAARAKGTAAVMATLWPVADDSTAELMQRFYRGWQAEAGISKAAALRNAQLALIRGGAAAGAASERGAARVGAAPAAAAGSAVATHDHPYFWAAFVLLGGFE